MINQLIIRGGVIALNVGFYIIATATSYCNEFPGYNQNWHNQFLWCGLPQNLKKKKKLLAISSGVKNISRKLLLHDNNCIPQLLILKQRVVSLHSITPLHVFEYLNFTCNKLHCCTLTFSPISCHLLISCFSEMLLIIHKILLQGFHQRMAKWPVVVISKLLVAYHMIVYYGVSQVTSWNR